MSICCNRRAGYNPAVMGLMGLAGERLGPLVHFCHHVRWLHASWRCIYWGFHLQHLHLKGRSFGNRLDSLCVKGATACKYRVIHEGLEKIVA